MADIELPQPDTAAAVAFLRLFEPEGPWVLTAIAPDRKAAAPATATFWPNDEAALARWLEQHNGRRNIYFSVNRPLRALTKKAERTDIGEVRWLHVDIDPRAGEDVAEERARALGLLTDRLPAGVPAPTAIIFSGGGYQGFWRLETPIPIGGELARAEDAKRYNQALERVFGADHCHNIDRIMRLPGTINLPDERKARKGRVPTLATLHSFDPERAYSLDRFDPAPAARPPADGGHVTDAPGAVERLADVRDLDRWGLPDRVKVIIVQGRDPDNPKDGDDSRSAWLFDGVCGMVRAGVPDDVIRAVLTDPGFGISESVLELGGRADSYAARQIAQAHSAVARDAAEFRCDKDGVPYANSQQNIRVALARLGVTVSYDEFQDRLMVAGLPECGDALNDAAMTRLWLLTDERFRFRPGKEFFWDVVTDAARRNAFHPVRDYLAALTWDGTPRLDGWLTAYGGAEDTPYTRAVGALMLVAAVRRVRAPGCKFDEMVVFESEQGKNKSSALAVLAVRSEWFTDDLPLNADSKVVIERLSGRWIVEAAELNGMRKSGIEHLKAFLSRQHDRARAAYARLVQEVPRQCVIVGTTNSERYLPDGTGNRRFWPVRVEGFDLDALRRDRDQLWAEAAQRETSGASIRLDRSLWSVAAEQQEARHVDDPFVVTLSAILGDVTGKLHAADAWELLGIPAGQRTQDHNARLGEAMRVLGWERTKLRFGGPRPEWCYAKGDASERQHRVNVTCGADGRARVVPF